MAIALNCWVAPTSKLWDEADGNIEIAETAFTVNFKLGLVTPERTAVMLVVPLPSPVTAPFAKIAATDEFELVQVTLEVMSAVVPSVYVPTAANCSDAPTPKSEGKAGVTAIEAKPDVEVITVKVTAGLVIPDSLAVMLVLPTATPVAKPVAMPAIELFELVQVTWDVIFGVVPSE